MKTRKLTLEEVEFMAHRLAVERMNSSEEPIPPFSTADRGKLESSIEAPFQTFDGKDLYESFVQKAAMLFYLVTKNHCFENGNKRMAVTTTVVFCYLNKLWLDMNPQDLYELACVVAKSDRKNKDATLKEINKAFKDYIKPLDR